MNNQCLCEHCCSCQVARPEWVNVNIGERISGDPGVYTKWCFGCEDQINIPP